MLKSDVGNFKHICKLLGEGGRSARSLSGIISLLLWLLKIASSAHPKSLPKVQYSKTLLRSQSKVLFELIKAFFLIYHTRWQMDPLLESEPDPALPEVVMQRNPLWPRLGSAPPTRTAARPIPVPWLAAEIFTWQGIGQSQLVPKAAWLTSLQCQIWRGKALDLIQRLAEEAVHFK